MGRVFRVDDPKSSEQTHIYEWCREVCPQFNELPEFTLSSEATTPEGVINGQPGHVLVNVSSDGTGSVWQKQSGTTSTGWVELGSGSAGGSVYGGLRFPGPSTRGITLASQTSSEFTVFTEALPTGGVSTSTIDAVVTIPSDGDYAVSFSWEGQHSNTNPFTQFNLLENAVPTGVITTTNQIGTNTRNSVCFDTIRSYNSNDTISIQVHANQATTLHTRFASFNINRL